MKWVNFIALLASLGVEVFFLLKWSRYSKAYNEEEKKKKKIWRAITIIFSYLVAGVFLYFVPEAEMTVLNKILAFIFLGWLWVAEAAMVVTVPMLFLAFGKIFLDIIFGRKCDPWNIHKHL